MEPFVRMNGETDFDKCGAVGLLQEIVADECQNHQQDECDEDSVDNSVCLSCLTCFARLFLCLVFQFVHGMLYFEVMLLYINRCVGCEYAAIYKGVWQRSHSGSFSENSMR